MYGTLYLKVFICWPLFGLQKSSTHILYLRSCTTLRLGAADLSRQASSMDLGAIDKSPASGGESEFTPFILDLFLFPTIFHFYVVALTW